VSADPVNRLAVDIGGTFTDVVLETAGGRTTVKVLTTPAAPEEGVLEGVRLVLDEAGAAPETIGVFLHGTTLATNAIIERKGAVTALVTTEGFRDALDIGYESRYNQYDVMIDKPASLVPRQRRFTVPERVDVRGAVLTPLDEAAVRAVVPQLLAAGAESVAVGYMHAYANPAHELRTREIIEEMAPGLSVSLSSEVCPEIREYERFSTTSANAYVRPLMSSYLGRLRDALSAMGIACPVLMMTSGGGLTALETARRFPIRLVESGPAGGAILASQIAVELGLDKVISFDMGGTTAKICLIENGEAGKAREFEVDRQARFMKGSGLPLRIPVIEMVEIGAGGGSIARVDSMNQITTGPDSAGADPGPAAYDRGGANATISDADIHLGRIDPGLFAGGRVKLAPEKSGAAIDRNVAGPLNISTHMAAFGITEMVDETMSNAARVHAVEQGYEASDHTLVAFGGAAPLHVGWRRSCISSASSSPPMPGWARRWASCARRWPMRWCAAARCCWANSISTPSTPSWTRCVRRRWTWSRPAPPARSWTSTASPSCATPARATRSSCRSRRGRSPTTTPAFCRTPSTPSTPSSTSARCPTPTSRC